jgi:uncharacterized protein YndB with AHSA1/START domain
VAERSGGAGPHGVWLTRVFPASRERLWREWTEPERFADWFGGRDAVVPLASVSMDPRPGGRWRATMQIEGAEIRWEGVYLELDEPERLVLTFSDEPGQEPHEIVTVVFTDLGDGRTEMRLEQSGTHPPDLYDQTLRGWSAFFERLSERLA